MAHKRHTRGTTLIEVLVVIVIFLVGILAVVRIFPKGIGILVLSRTSSMATALSRDQVELLKAHPEQLPENIVAMMADGVTLNPGRNPNNLGPVAGTTLTKDGILMAGPTAIGDWALYSGANAYRHVVGETRAITAPRRVGSGAGLYGSLEILQFGPVDYIPASGPSSNGNFAVYGNDLTMHVGAPADGEIRTDDQFYVTNANDATIAVGLPSGPLVLSNNNPNHSDRIYYLSFSAYVRPTAGGAYVRRDFSSTDLDPVVVPRAAPVSGQQPLTAVNLSALVAGAGFSLGSVDLSTLRVNRGYAVLTNLNDDWENDEPYVCKLLNPQLGVILFSPYAFGQTVAGPMGREPLVAKVDYNVYDWRILREEFRFPFQQGTTNLIQNAQHQLAVGSIKVGGTPGPDGRNNPVIDLLENPSVASLKLFNNVKDDNFVLMDLDTGGVYCERDPTIDAYEGTPFIDVNKSTGLVTVLDLDPNTDGTQADLLLPDQTVERVTIDSRAVRALYRGRNEMAVQVFKAAASYNVSPTPAGMGPAHYYIGGTGAGGGATRIYFPVGDIGQKITFGVMNYRTSGGQSRQVLDQDFVVRTANGEIAPFIDLRDVDPQAQSFDLGVYGYAVRNVKGSSVTVRTLWNPDTFNLGDDPAKNMQLLDAWGRGWRKSTNETYLEQGALIR